MTHREGRIVSSEWEPIVLGVFLTTKDCIVPPERGPEHLDTISLSIESNKRQNCRDPKV